jgi:DNA-directed RNA polymerase specialized sigma subunit
MIRSEELATMLRLAVAELDPPDQLLLALRFTDDRPVREIAIMLGLPTVFHVYRRLRIVVAALRRSLAGRGVDGPEA